MSFCWDRNGNSCDQGWESGIGIYYGDGNGNSNGHYQGWDGNGENEMAHRSHQHIHLPTFTCAFVRRQPHQPKEVRTDGGNRSCLLNMGKTELVCFLLQLFTLLYMKT